MIDPLIMIDPAFRTHFDRVKCLLLRRFAGATRGASSGRELFGRHEQAAFVTEPEDRAIFERRRDDADRGVEE